MLYVQYEIIFYIMQGKDYEFLISFLQSNLSLPYARLGKIVVHDWSENIPKSQSICLIENGQIYPADARLITLINLIPSASSITDAYILIYNNFIRKIK